MNKVQVIREDTALVFAAQPDDKTVTPKSVFIPELIDHIRRATALLLLRKVELCCPKVATVHIVH